LKSQQQQLGNAFRSTIEGKVVLVTGEPPAWTRPISGSVTFPFIPMRKGLSEISGASIA
jgi:hypothetical protein